MRLFFSILTGRVVRFLCRLLRRGGTGLPGRIALKIEPELLQKLSKNVRCILVTGTNGKTTTVRMIEQGLRLSGQDYFANLTGANLTEGIATDFLMNATITGRCKKSIALLETDEFACREICRVLQPEILLVTNLFVDQVERYGGVEGSLAAIAEGISKTPGTCLILNADDCVSASLGRNVPNTVVSFGVCKEAAEACGDPGFSDVTKCVLCGGDLSFSYRTIAHLGDFACEGCGTRRQVPDYLLTSVTVSDLDRSVFSLKTPDGEETISVNLPELYNMYNAMGAYAAMLLSGVEKEAAKEALSTFRCGFGRMEQFPALGAKGARMVLVKNGAGCDQVLRYLKKYQEPFSLCIYLNNNPSDGVDISWLEDVDFESLKCTPVREIFLSGMRMKEVRQRLLQSGIPEERLKEIPDVRQLIARLKNCDTPLFILPTYTGMMETRSEIVRQCGGSEYWEELQ